MRAPKPNPRPIPPDLAADFLIDSASTHWNASKNPAFRQRVLDRFTTFFHFAQQHGLTRHERLSGGESATPQAILRRSDLTEAGFAFTWAYYDAWLRHLDKNQPIDDSFLLACLHQFSRNA